MWAHVFKTLSSTSRFRQNIRKRTHISVSVHKDVHSGTVQRRCQNESSGIVLSLNLFRGKLRIPIMTIISSFLLQN